MGIVRHVLFFGTVNYWHFGFGFKVFREKIMVQNQTTDFSSSVCPWDKGVLFTSGHTRPSAYKKHNQSLRPGDYTEQA